MLFTKILAGAFVIALVITLVVLLSSEQQSVGHPVEQSVGHPVEPSVGHPVEPSVGQSVIPLGTPNKFYGESRGVWAGNPFNMECNKDTSDYVTEL